MHHLHSIPIQYPYHSTPIIFYCPMMSYHPISALNTHKLLLSKYDCPTNFYLAKPINHIIHNRNHQQSNLIAKDIATLVQDLEYLKRYYHECNGQGKNEIHDRMTLLINFYATANMLQYEYPNMVISNTQEMFKKRRKKLNQLKNKKQDQDDDDDDDSSDGSNNSKASQKGIIKLQIHAQQSILQDLDWSDIINCYIPTQKKQKVQEQLQIDEECSIYDQQPKRTDSFFQKISKLTSQLTYQMNFDAQENQKEVCHLILDFDDLDREKIVYQYRKLTNKENIPLNTPKIQGLKHPIQSLNDKKPLSCSITIDTLRESSFNDRPAPSKQSMIGSRDERDKQVNLVKRSSLLEASKKTFIFDEDMIINENQCEESPLIDSGNQLNFHPQQQKSKSRIFPSENARIFPAENVRIFPSQSKNIPTMKQSQIIYNDYFIKQKYQNKHPHDYKTQLQRLKENPVQLDEILKIQTQYQHHPHPPSMVKQSSMDFHTHPPERPQLPFYLKRVKTHEQPKPIPDDNPFQRTKKK